MNVPAIIKKRVERLVKEATRAELSLLGPLEILCESQNLSLKFQHPIRLEDYRWCIADLLIDGRLNIELDGAHHRENPKQVKRDKDRDERLKEMGIKVLRLPNDFVTRDPVGLALLIIKKILKAKGRELTVTRYELEAEIQMKLYESLGIPFIG